MYCNKCGATVKNKYCEKCGNLVNNYNDSYAILFGILGFFCCLLGFILYFILKDKEPKNAKYALWGALLSIIISFGTIFIVILAFIIFGIFSALILGTTFSFFDIKIDNKSIDEYAIQYIEDTYKDTCSVYRSSKDIEQSLEYSRVDLACDNINSIIEVEIYDVYKDDRFYNDNYYAVLYENDITEFISNAFVNEFSSSNLFFKDNTSFFTYFSSDCKNVNNIEEFLSCGSYNLYDLKVFVLDSDYKNGDQIRNLLNFLDSYNIYYDFQIFFLEDKYYNEIDEEFVKDNIYSLEKQITANRYFNIKNRYDEYNVEYYELQNKRYVKVDKY